MLGRQEIPNDEVLHHVLCGPTTTAGATCPNCAKELLTLARLDPTDPKLDLSALGLRELPLLYCWTCEHSQEEFVYAFLDRGLTVQLLKFQVGVRFSDFPYVNYPSDSLRSQEASVN